MSRSGTANGGGGGGGSSSTPMVRSGTNTSSVGKTPSASVVGAGVTGRAGRGMSSSASESPSLTTSAAGAAAAAAGLMMQGGGGGTGLTPQGGLGLGLTPLGMGMGMGGGGVVQGLVGMSPSEQEEERRRRVEVIREMVGTRAAGWVCQEGVERAARKVGLECLWEEAMGVGEKRVLSIAGSGLLVEVDFYGDAVSEVGLSFPASKEGEDGVARWAKKGSEILKRDLRGDERDGYVGLERFVRNLEQLAKMDQLGGEQVSCFDAVDGVFKSLQRIYEWEVSVARKEKSLGAEDEAMCNHSGRPQMHAGRRIGLALQYWRDRRLVSESSNTSEAMTLDDAPTEKELDDDGANVWSILVECEACSATLYDPIRLSEQWVSKDVERPANQELDSEHISIDRIDWLDVKDLGFGEGKTPDVRFLARFEPPVLVPLQLAMQIHESVNSPVDQNTVLPTTYEALLFADIDAQVPMLTTPRMFEQTLPSHGPKKSQKYGFTLFNQSQDFAQSITEIPFKHPMQIVSLLPTLRQWVLVGTLLRRSFTPHPLEQSSAEADAEANGGNPSENNNNNTNPPPTFQTLEDELTAFLSSPSPTPSSATHPSTVDKPLPVEISFITSPLPRFTVHFHNPKYGHKLASVAFAIGLNGVFEGVEVDDGRSPPVPQSTDSRGGQGADGGLEGGGVEEEMMVLREKVRKVLALGESIGMLVDWLSR